MNVLSIQSHVASGHVGNSAAVFALQRMGHEVWPVHTLQYSNHPGHGDFGGAVFEPDSIRDVLIGLDRLGLFPTCDAVLSGYLGRADVGEAIVSAVQSVKQQRSDALYCCDPVMGDTEAGIYVDDDVVELLAESAVPHADILTPNAFELARLGAARGDALDDPVAGAARLLRRGPGLVVVTGIEDTESSVGTIAVTAQGAWRVDTPRLDLGRRPDGAGDLFTAVFLGHYLERRNAEWALMHAVSSVYGVLVATADAGARELDIVRAQEQLVAPSRVFEATSLY